MKTQRTFSVLLTAIAVIAMAGLGVVGTASAAVPGPVQIAIKAQNCCDTGLVVIDSVTAAQDGWLGIFKDSTASLDALVGYTPVHQGQNMGLTADVNSGRVGQAPTLWAALLVDESGFGVFDINTVALAPNTPIVGFATEAAAQPAVPAAPTTAAAPGPVQITIKAQNCCDTGEVVINSVTATQDGWLGIFKDSTASLDALVGYTPVHQGQNMGFTADVNSGRVGQAPTLWAALLVDESGTGIFDINGVALAPNTPIVGFATEANVQPAAPVAASTNVAKGPSANQIAIKAQDCCDTGLVVIGSVTAAQDGWLGIFKDSTASLNALVGYTPVHQGQNMGLTADVNSGRVGQAPTLWAALLVDESGTGIFDVNGVALAPNTPIVGFATVAAGR